MRWVAVRVITIHVHPEAPPKPEPGERCNGCGVCCLSEPCPLGMLVSRRRHGACDAVRWDSASASYRCGLLADAVAGSQHPGVWGLWARWRARALRRWIASGQGCDAWFDLEVLKPSASDRP